MLACRGPCTCAASCAFCSASTAAFRRACSGSAARASAAGGTEVDRCMNVHVASGKQWDADAQADATYLVVAHADQCPRKSGIQWCNKASAHAHFWTLIKSPFAAINCVRFPTSTYCMCQIGYRLSELTVHSTRTMPCTHAPSGVLTTSFASRLAAAPLPDAPAAANAFCPGPCSCSPEAACLRACSAAPRSRLPQASCAFPLAAIC